MARDSAKKPLGGQALIDHLLSLENDVRDAAESQEGDNSDALKAALRNAAHGIAHIRKAQDQLARLER